MEIQGTFWTLLMSHITSRDLKLWWGLNSYHWSWALSFQLHPYFVIKGALEKWEIVGKVVVMSTDWKCGIHYNSINLPILETSYKYLLTIIITISKFLEIVNIGTQIIFMIIKTYLSPSKYFKADADYPCDTEILLRLTNVIY